MATVGWIAVVVAVVWALAYFRSPLIVWTVATLASLVLCLFTIGSHTFWLVVLLSVASVVLVPLNFPPLRRALISNRMFAAFRRILPPMSVTEREALDAGTVWWEADLFRGDPDWKKLLALPPPRLSPEE